MPETQASRPLPGILARIVRTKRAELEGLRVRAGELERAAEAAPPARGFAAALRRGGGVAVIAECKRRSPGAGPIRPDLDPARLARAYRDGGAAALSVLTDAAFFGGSEDDLRSARAAVELPVLRKDFTLDPLQVLEARSMGADAVLLIVRLLDDEALAGLLGAARGLGMDALVETHDQGEMERALAAGASLVGINNRDLDTFTTDVDVTLRLAAAAGPDVTLVSESGIRGPADVERLRSVGVRAVLVGESLLRAADPGAAVRALAAAGGERPARARG